MRIEDKEKPAYLLGYAYYDWTTSAGFEFAGAGTPRKK
jgi:hypothetical protein